MTRVDQVELVRHASDVIASLFVDVHHSTVVVPRLDHSWITACVKGNYDCRICPSNQRSEREREREEPRISSVVCKERLNIFPSFVRFLLFFFLNIRLWRIHCDLERKVLKKYICFLLFNYMNCNGREN